MSDLPFIQPTYDMQLKLRGELQKRARAVNLLALVVCLLMGGWQFVKMFIATQFSDALMLTGFWWLCLALIFLFVWTVKHYGPFRFVIALMIGLSIVTVTRAIANAVGPIVLDYELLIEAALYVLGMVIFSYIYLGDQAEIKLARDRYYDEVRRHYEIENELFAQQLMKHHGLKPELSLFDVLSTSGFALVWICSMLLVIGYGAWLAWMNDSSQIAIPLTCWSVCMLIGVIRCVKDLLVDGVAYVRPIPEFLCVIGMIFSFIAGLWQISLAFTTVGTPGAVIDATDSFVIVMSCAFFWVMNLICLLRTERRWSAFFLLRFGNLDMNRLVAKQFV